MTEQAGESYDELPDGGRVYHNVQEPQWRDVVCEPHGLHPEAGVEGCICIGSGGYVADTSLSEPGQESATEAEHTSHGLAIGIALYCLDKPAFIQWCADGHPDLTGPHDPRLHRHVVLFEPQAAGLLTHHIANAGQQLMVNQNLAARGGLN